MLRKKHSKIIIKTAEEIEGIRASCQLTKQVLDMVGERIKAGVSTNQINDWVHEYTIGNGGTPAPLNYRGFPKSVCTSINDIILHGIPDDTILKDGDIVNVDVTCILNDYYGDASRMFFIGEVSDDAKRLVDIAHECMMLGVKQVRPGSSVGHIGHAIQRHAEGNGYSVVREFVGHGIGIDFHEPPDIVHYGRRGRGPIFREGMIFTVEPMINAGSRECRTLEDGWTTVTVDGSLSAQWEHTVAVTRTGVEILTD